MKNLLIALLLVSYWHTIAQSPTDHSFSAVLLKAIKIKNIENDTITRLFDGDQVEVTDYTKDNSSETFEFYFNGKKYLTAKENLFIPDSTFNYLKQLTQTEREVVRQNAKHYSKYCYDIEFQKAHKYYYNAKEKGLILINPLDQNWFDKTNTNYEFEFINTSSKTIHRIWISLVGFNSKEENKIVEAKIVFFEGIIKEDEFGYKQYKNVLRSKKIISKTIKSIKIEYSDGSTAFFDEPEYFPKSYLYYAIGKTFQIDNIPSRE